MPLTEEKLRKSLRCLYREIEDVFLFPLHIKSPFCLDSTFSKLDLRLSAFPSLASKDKKMGFPVSYIVTPLDSLTLSGHEETLFKILKAREVEWPTPLLHPINLCPIPMYSIYALQY